MVAGFVAYDYDEADGHYLILESNAHAWTEVRTGRHRWTTFDPAPPATLRQLHDVEVTFADRLSWIYQRFEGSWNAQVASFDVGAQGRLVEALRRHPLWPAMATGSRSPIWDNS